ncbi:speckle-type POZ protein-like [Musca vetustissima]|uniref:speckle-type POZ protein-like n=1 Tax=Musca vetustissima TaxID=27455 RepID=UPI002AB6B910|nr:speckle-type POZ protein-like [Musca vetustissima]
MASLAKTKDKTYSVSNTVFSKIDYLREKDATKGNYLHHMLAQRVQNISQKWKFIQVDVDMTLLASLAKLMICDVALVAQDRIEFKAHKVVLCARSDVFRAMFRNDLQEKKTGSITIDDMDSDVLKKLLNYIYTDEEMPKEMAADLFVAANKYALVDLQKICEDILIEVMSDDTVADILLLGDRHSSERLKSKAVQFVIENIKNVMATEGWHRLRANDRDVCLDILEKVMQMQFG